MHRKATMDATSSGSAILPIGSRAISFFTSSGSIVFCLINRPTVHRGFSIRYSDQLTTNHKLTSLLMSVLTPPGATQLTRMPSRAHSAARLLVSWFMAPLVTE